MKNTTDETHSGHRKRLRDLINKAGLQSLNQIQLLEQILTMSNSRKDTNKTAHNLLKKFGSISKVLDANPIDLEQVEGVGKVTAQTLSYLPQIFALYFKDKVTNSKLYSCNTYGDVYRFFAPIFACEKQECVYIAFVNKANYFESYYKLANGDIDTVALDTKELTSCVFAHKPYKIYLAHNHIFGSAMPSRQDYDSHSKIINILDSLGFTVCDNIIVDNNGFYSHRLGDYIDMQQKED